ncbi:MAG: hypothetical protein M5U09_19305 [Gammaproteobacteria bacterium]|nr:hypothetical protein [Gammaproteobacteria bacterium]
MEPVMTESRDSLGRKLVRKAAQGLAFGNLATLAVLQQHGPRAAVFYLQQLARTYHDRRELLCRSDRCRSCRSVRRPARCPKRGSTR